MPLGKTLSDFWHRVQGDLFPFLAEELGPLDGTTKRLIAVLEMVQIESFVSTWSGFPGRPPSDRAPLARAFIAKVVLRLPGTDMLIERLGVDPRLRRLCGWERPGLVPSESTFSRAFAEFAASGLPARVHAALIEAAHVDRLVGHVSRDATAIVAREKPARAVTTLEKTKSPPATPKRKRGRPRKGEVVAKPEPRRLERQGSMSVAEMLADLPKVCTVGCKRNAKGHTETWIGYKLHIDTADGDIPVSCLLTSASVHDSQVAIPLATITAERLRNLYDLMDSAYDAPEIAAHSRSLGHVPIIDANPRRGGKAAAAAEARARRHVGHVPAEEIRFRERSAAERVNSSLKDSYGGRTVRVRGHVKVYCHLMFGILALSAERIMNMVT